MGARFAPFSFGGLLLQSYRPHLTQANRTHRTGIPSTTNLVDSMNTLFVNNEKMKLRCVQMMVRLVAEKRLGEENRKAGKNSWGVHSRHKESPRKHSVFKGLWWSQQDSNLWSRCASLASVSFAMVASRRCRLRRSLAQYASASLHPALRALGSGAPSM